MKKFKPIKYTGITVLSHIKITPEKILNTVADITCISIEEMKSQKRQAKLVEARQIAIYLIKKHSKLTLKEIGKMFGNRDHTTVIYAIRTIDGLMEVDKKFNFYLTNINRKLYEN